MGASPRTCCSQRESTVLRPAPDCSLQQGAALSTSPIQYVANGRRHQSIPTPRRPIPNPVEIKPWATCDTGCPAMGRRGPFALPAD